MRKTELVLIVIVVALSCFIYWGTKKYFTERNNSDRRYVNQVESYDSIARVLTLTKNELVVYLDNNKRLERELKKEKIKPKDVRYIIKEKMVYVVDTIKVHVGEKNGDVYPIRYENDCLSFNGSIDIDNINVILTDLKYNNTSTHVAYMKKKPTGRKFLWVFNINKKYLELHTKNSCGDSKTEMLNIVK